MFHSADLPSKIPGQSSNISDYEKMLQYTSGFRDVPSGAQVLIPSPLVRGPGSVDSGYETQNYSRKASGSVRNFTNVESTAVSHSYNPGKYGVVAPQPFYDTSYYPKDVQNPAQRVDYQNHGTLRDSQTYTGDRQHAADQDFQADNQLKQQYSNVYESDTQQAYPLSQAIYPAGLGQARNRHSYHGEEIDAGYTSPMTTPPTLSSHDVLNTYQTPVKSKMYARTDYYNVAQEPAGYGRSASSASLQQWQQQHKEHLLQQQLESQVLYGGGSQTSLDGVFQQLRLKEEDSARLDPVRRAADNIIREKDAVINRLKKHIYQLEDDNMSLDKKLRQSHAVREDRDESDQLKIQELQHKIACLKNELADLRSQKNEEIDSLENKLGATEYENSQLRKALKDKQTHVDSYISQVSEKDRELGEWKSRYQEMTDSHKEARKKLDQLELYLGGLPTAEAVAQTEMELHKVKQQHQQAVLQVDDLETKLREARKRLTARDFTEQELQLTVKQLTAQVDELTTQLEGLRSDGVGASLFHAQEELQELREEKERLAIDLEKAKKLLEKTVRNLRRLEKKYQDDVRQLSEQLSREEESVTVLREDIASKDELIENLRKTIRELGSEKQDLVEQTLILREQLQHFEVQLADDSARLQRRLMVELGLCFSNLQSLVHFCMQRVNGEHPNMSILLGSKTASSEEDDLPTKVEGQTLKHWLTRVADLREKIDKLKGIICNKYAEDMGDNLTCNPQ